MMVESMVETSRPVIFGDEVKATMELQLMNMVARLNPARAAKNAVNYSDTKRRAQTTAKKPGDRSTSRYETL